MQENVDDQLEETLSLCDLPLYSDQSADWDQEYSSLTSSNEDYFEFFIQERAPSAAGRPPENIIFCGKIITYKQLSPCKPDSSSNQLEIKNQTKNSRRWRWKFCSKRKSSSLQSRKRYNAKKLGKAKWYFFLFGISRFSPVVELRDIRSRQSRRQSRSPPPPPPVMFGSRNGDDDKKVSADRGWGLWALIIRALSCGGNHLPTTVATADAGASAPPE